MLMATLAIYRHLGDGRIVYGYSTYDEANALTEKVIIALEQVAILAECTGFYKVKLSPDGPREWYVPEFHVLEGDWEGQGCLVHSGDGVVGLIEYADADVRAFQTFHYFLNTVYPA
jgi:hypothetical protein